ncbi:hypothetical protein BDR07DRAFT_1376235 [Suillus spraguei]|nr:hypothetical protein BDR07DRAFT_1376235 [Suillus spraguei]
MKKGKSSTQRDSAQDPHATTEPTVPGSSHRPRGKVRRFLEKVKDSANKLKGSDSLDRRPVPPNPNINHESAPNLTAQTAPSAVGVEAVPSVLQDVQEVANHMHSLSEPATGIVSDVQGAQQGLDSLDNFQDTYLKPLKIFDTVIAEIANVCRCIHMQRWHWAYCLLQPKLS